MISKGKQLIKYLHGKGYNNKPITAYVLYDACKYFGIGPEQGGEVYELLAKYNMSVEVNPPANGWEYYNPHSSYSSANVMFRDYMMDHIVFQKIPSATITKEDKVEVETEMEDMLMGLLSEEQTDVHDEERSVVAVSQTEGVQPGKAAELG